MEFEIDPIISKEVLLGYSNSRTFDKRRKHLNDYLLQWIQLFPDKRRKHLNDYLLHGYNYFLLRE